MKRNTQITCKDGIKKYDKWSGLADFLARMIEKYGDSLGLDDLPTPEFVKNYDKRAEVLRRYAELLAKIYAKH